MNLQKLQIRWALFATLCLCAVGNAPAFGQKMTANIRTSSVEPGEELIYKAEISRSVLRKLDVAMFRFSATRTAGAMQTNAAGEAAVQPNATPYMLSYTADVSSEGFFVTLFKVHFRQHVESIVDPDSLTVQKTIKLDEQGKRVRSSETIFDRTTGKIIWTERNPNDPTRPARVETADLRGPVQDVVSAIYFIRAQQLEAGKRFDIPVSDSGRVYSLPVIVAERQKRKTVLGRVSVVRIVVDMFGERGLVNAKGQFSLWLTDDSRHIPVAALVKTEYGTFDITLQKVSHEAKPTAAPGSDLSVVSLFVYHVGLVNDPGWNSIPSTVPKA